MQKMNPVSKRIKKVRSILKLTQQEFVAPLRLSQAALSLIEKGGGVSSETIAEINKRWQVNLEWLLHGNGAPFPRDMEEILSDDLSFYFNTSVGKIKRIAEYLMKDKPSEKMLREWGKTIYDEANKLIKINLEFKERNKRKAKKSQKK